MKKNTTQNLKKIFITLLFVVLFLFTPTYKTHALTLTPIRLELSGDPGQTLTEQITLINERKTAETFYTSFENFSADGETGNPTWTTPVDDLGTWMKSSDTVTLLPGEQKNVPFTITIPKNAEPGGHFAGIFWGTTPKLQAGGQVAIGAKTGVLVLLSVSGPVSEKGGILDFATKDGKSFYTALPINFFYRFQNNGSDRIKPDGDIVIHNVLGLGTTKIPANPIGGNILPKSIRRIETMWGTPDVANNNTVDVASSTFLGQVSYEWNNFALGHYTAHLDIAYGKGGEIASALYSFWIFPWQLLCVIFVSLVLAYLILHGAIRHYNKWVISRAEKMFEEHEAQMNHIKKKTVLHKIVGPKLKKK